jgi:hypothetical protein
MKDILYEIQQDAPFEGKLVNSWKNNFLFVCLAVVGKDETKFKSYIQNADDHFFQYCDRELAKINAFFGGKFLFD